MASRHSFKLLLLQNKTQEIPDIVSNSSKAKHKRSSRFFLNYVLQKQEPHGVSEILSNYSKTKSFRFLQNYVLKKKHKVSPKFFQIAQKQNTRCPWDFFKLLHRQNFTGCTIWKLLLFQPWYSKAPVSYSKFYILLK